MWSVPRILSRIYDKMNAGFSRLEGVQKMLFDLAWQSKMKGLAFGRLKSFWDFIIFAPAAAALGGRIKYIVCCIFVSLYCQYH